MNKLKTVLLLMVLASSVSAQVQEAKIQAVFILKFIENVKWPQNSPSMVLGIVGKSEIATELEERLKVRNPMNIVVKKITAAEASICNVVFLPKNANGSLGNVNAAIGSQSVLLITESDFTKQGSCISFIEEAGRMHFIVNKNTIEAKGLKVTSTLLTLGKQA